MKAGGVLIGRKAPMEEKGMKKRLRSNTVQIQIAQWSRAHVTLAGNFNLVPSTPRKTVYNHMQLQLQGIQHF